jgi:hypothetical protein
MEHCSTILTADELHTGKSVQVQKMQVFNHQIMQPQHHTVPTLSHSRRNTKDRGKVTFQTISRHFNCPTLFWIIIFWRTMP